METGARAQQDKLSGQTGLFSALFVAEEVAEPALPKLPDWTDAVKLSGEKEMLGFYVTGHPLNEFIDKVKELATHDSETIEGLAKGAEVAVCGIITGLQRRRNKEGKLWASFMLEDLNGVIETMAFTTQYEKVLSALIEDKAVLVRGLALPDEGGATKVSAQDIIPLDVVRVPLPSLISIRVGLNGKADADKAEQLMALFGKKPGSAEVRLRLEKPKDFSIILDVTTRVRPDKEFRAEVERICGPESLETLAAG
jgi:DNA polymerase-3 subunit alpha